VNYIDQRALATIQSKAKVLAMTKILVKLVLAFDNLALQLRVMTVFITNAHVSTVGQKKYMNSEFPMYIYRARTRTKKNSA
jgi:hypothetical protein